MPTVLITGATSGFGRATALLFAKAGYRLMLNARRTERLEALRNMLEDAYGTESFALPFDIRNREEVESAITGLPPAWQQVDILINNAGLAVGRDLFHEAEVDDWERMIDTNVKGLLYLSRVIGKKMVQQEGGHIINISSLAGQEVYPMGNVYCATKHAVTALSKAMRMDLLPFGVRVTNISPGLAETEFSLVRFKGDAAKAASVYAGYIPLSAEDVAEVIFFAATRPAHVNIEEITILPTAQSDSRTVRKK